MKKNFGSNWFELSFTISVVIIVLAYGYHLRGLDRPLEIASVLAIIFTLLVLRNKYVTHVSIEDRRWITNSGASGKHKIDAASIVYIARAPQYVFRSWGARMIIFYREEARAIRATWLNESQYTQETLRALLAELVSMKPNIEID